MNAPAPHPDAMDSKMLERILLSIEDGESIQFSRYDEIENSIRVDVRAGSAHAGAHLQNLDEVEWKHSLPFKVYTLLQQCRLARKQHEAS